MSTARVPRPSRSDGWGLDDRAPKTHGPHWTILPHSYTLWSCPCIFAATTSRDTHFWTISCYRRLQFFHDDGLKQVAIEALRTLQAQLGVCIVGYVIMPEHVHVLLYPHPRGNDVPIPIAELLQVFKQYIGRRGKQRLRDVWRRRRRLWSDPLNRWARGSFPKQEVMNTRGYDRNIFTERELRKKLDYCHKNPRTRGLVDDPADGKWSSYRFYERGDRSLLPMDWDGRWPIEW